MSFRYGTEYSAVFHRLEYGEELEIPEGEVWRVWIHGDTWESIIQLWDGSSFERLIHFRYGDESQATSGPFIFKGGRRIKMEDRDACGVITGFKIGDEDGQDGEEVENKAVDEFVLPGERIKVPEDKAWRVFVTGYSDDGILQISDDEEKFEADRLRHFHFNQQIEHTMGPYVLPPGTWLHSESGYDRGQHISGFEMDIDEDIKFDHIVFED